METHRLKLKALLGITDDSKDEVLDFTLATVKDIICNYCRTEKVPEGLENIWLDMCVALFRGESLGQETAEGVVKSIAEGDTSISFGSAFSNGEDGVMVFLRNYSHQLDRYRRVGW